jgi:3',5'-cyclic AMP phosphodiesterase CpdA
VRAARPKDSHHEIRLLHAHEFRPSHFPGVFQQSSSRSVLWLSDVHFSVDGHHAFPLKPGEAERPLGARIEQAFNAFGVNDLGGIVLSGDLSWKAAPEEFGEAKALIERLQTWSRVENYQVAVCPGNHDVAFSDDPAEKGTPIVRAGEAATNAYSTFYSDLFNLAPNAFLSCGRKLLLGSAVPVELVCLNSSFLSQTRDLFQGHGFVGEGQLEDAARQMGWTETESDDIPVRIVVVHHHLVPVIYRETPVAGRSYSTVLDAEALVRWLLRYRVKVVLHGHMHTPFHTVLERSIRFGEGEPRRIHVFGMGSSGVEQGHLSEEVPHNLFGVLRFSRETLTVTYYSVHPVNEPQKLKEYVVPLWE